MQEFIYKIDRLMFKIEVNLCCWFDLYLFYLLFYFGVLGFWGNDSIHVTALALALASYPRSEKNTD